MDLLRTSSGVTKFNISHHSFALNRSLKHPDFKERENIFHVMIRCWQGHVEKKYTGWQILLQSPLYK